MTLKLLVAAILFALLLPMAFASVSGSYVNGCVATAPSQTSCDTGPFVNSGYFKIGVQDICLTGCLWHTVDGVPGFRGIVQSHLVWSGGEEIFSCTFINVTDEVTGSCTSWGIWPPDREPIIQHCTSLDVETGQPGGNGMFGCISRHY